MIEYKRRHQMTFRNPRFKLRIIKMKFCCVVAILFCAYLLKPATAGEECEDFMKELIEKMDELKGEEKIGEICLSYTEMDPNGDIKKQMEDKRKEYLENDEDTRKQIKECAQKAMGEIMDRMSEKPEKCLEELQKNCMFRDEE